MAWASWRQSNPRGRATDMRARVRHRSGRIVPGVPFGLALFQPGMKGVVHHHALGEHGVVVDEISGQAQRQRMQAGTNGTQIMPVRVRAPDDRRQLCQDGVIQPMLVDEGVKAAQLAPVTVFGQRFLNWRSAKAPACFRMKRLDDRLAGNVLILVVTEASLKPEILSRSSVVIRVPATSAPC